MVTIWDVAAQAGVSKSTVSLVLNNSPLVKEETRVRVQSAIDSLQYTPNYNARNLIKRQNNSIGIIHTVRRVTDLSRKYDWDSGMSQFSRDVEDGIFEEVIDLNSDVSVIVEHHNIGQNEEEIPRVVRGHRVDGAIVMGSLVSQTFLACLQKTRLPVVVINSIGMEGLDTIDVVLHDPVMGSRMAVRRLIQTGHERICLINCPVDFPVFPLRIQGFREAAEELGSPVDPELLIAAEKNTTMGAYLALRKLLDSGRRPDAILAANNEMAMGALRCLYERNLRVPEDISLICYEDTAICGNMAPPLTAVNIQKEQLGRTAVQLLMERMASPNMAARIRRIEPYLVERGSVRDRRND